MNHGVFWSICFLKSRCCLSAWLSVITIEGELWKRQLPTLLSPGGMTLPCGLHLCPRTPLPSVRTGRLDNVPACFGRGPWREAGLGGQRNSSPGLPASPAESPPARMMRVSVTRWMVCNDRGISSVTLHCVFSQEVGASGP